MQQTVELNVWRYGGWEREKRPEGWAMKEMLIWACQCFSVLSAALSSLERPAGGWSVWGLRAGSTGHCVGRGSASASPDCPWFVPFPAHSYVIICDKLLCSQATNPRQWPGLPNNSEKATCTRGLEDAGTCARTHIHRGRDTNMYSHTPTHT